jgi:hypothetical protein
MRNGDTSLSHKYLHYVGGYSLALSYLDAMSSGLSSVTAFTPIAVYYRETISNASICHLAVQRCAQRHCAQMHGSNK